MQLLWLFYKGKSPRYLLILELERTNGKIIGIETKSIDAGARNKIISAKSQLDTLSLDRKIKWLKHYCPQAMRECKTLYESKSTIMKAYPVSDKMNKKQHLDKKN